MIDRTAQSRTLVARDVMARHPICVGTDASISEIAEILDQNGVSGVPVIDEHDRVIGVVSKTDLVCRILEGVPGSTLGRYGEALGLARGTGCGLDPDEIGSAGDIMNPDPVTATEEQPLHLLAQQMSAERVHRIIVVDPNGKVRGVVTTLDVLEGFPAPEV